MMNAQPALQPATWAFRVYQAALAVIGSVLGLILVLVVSTGGGVSAGVMPGRLGLPFLVYLSPATLSLILAAGLSMTGQRPGPVAAGFTALAALWAVFNGYLLVPA